MYVIGKGESFSNSLWIYDIIDSKWSSLGPFHNSPTQWPAPRDRHAMTYVKSLNAVFLFGGRTSASSSSTSSSPSFQILDDLWVFDLSSRVWKQLAGDSWGALDLERYTISRENLFMIYYTKPSNFV